ncbi:hypothetical protein GGQ73_004693, partial [Rhizobium skierniewicense]
RGACVVNLAHSASFHSLENIAPSNAGIKHLERAKQILEFQRNGYDLSEYEDGTGPARAMSEVN